MFVFLVACGVINMALGDQLLRHGPLWAKAPYDRSWPSRAGGHRPVSDWYRCVSPPSKRLATAIFAGLAPRVCDPICVHGLLNLVPISAQDQHHQVVEQSMMGALILALGRRACSYALRLSSWSSATTHIPMAIRSGPSEPWAPSWGIG
jgi:hypothetical protein